MDLAGTLEGIAQKLRLLDKLQDKLSSVLTPLGGDPVFVLDWLIRQAGKITCSGCSGTGRFWDSRCARCGGCGERPYDPKSETSPEPPPAASGVDATLKTCMELCSVLNVKAKFVIETDKRGDMLIRIGVVNPDDTKSKHVAWTRSHRSMADAVASFQERLVDAVWTEAQVQKDWARYASQDGTRRHDSLMGALERIVVRPVIED